MAGQIPTLLRLAVLRRAVLRLAILAAALAPVGGCASHNFDGWGLDTAPVGGGVTRAEAAAHWRAFADSVVGTLRHRYPELPAVGVCLAPPIPQTPVSQAFATYLAVALVDAGMGPIPCSPGAIRLSTRSWLLDAPMQLAIAVEVADRHGLLLARAGVFPVDAADRAAYRQPRRRLPALGSMRVPPQAVESHRGDRDGG